MDLSNYTTKANLKRATSVDTSKLAAKTDLASLRVGVVKWDVNTLKTVHVDLTNLINIVDNDVDNIVR